MKLLQEKEKVFNYVRKYVPYLFKVLTWLKFFFYEKQFIVSSKEKGTLIPAGLKNRKGQRICLCTYSFVFSHVYIVMLCKC